MSETLSPSPEEVNNTAPQNSEAKKSSANEKENSLRTLEISRDRLYQLREEINRLEEGQEGADGGEPDGTGEPAAPTPPRRPRRPNLEYVHASYSIQRNSHVRILLDLWREGKIDEIIPEDLSLVAEDLAELGTESVLAKREMSNYGFENAQDALRKLKLREVSLGDDRVIERTDQGFQRWFKEPIVQEQLKKLGISSAGAVTAAGVIALCGGPVSLLAIAGGLVGSVVGRGLGELVRNRMLRKRVDVERISAGEDGPVRQEAFNKQVGEKLFGDIAQWQRFAEDISANESMTDEEKAQKILGIIEGAHDSQALRTESNVELDQRYRTMEKRAGWIKAGLTTLGAIGGGMLGSWLHNGVITQPKIGMEESRMQDALDGKGVRLDLDGDHFAHMVKKDINDEWRFLFERHDVNEVSKMATQKGSWVYEYFNHYNPLTGEVNPMQGINPPTPTFGEYVPNGTEYIHSTALDPAAVEGAIREKFNAIIGEISNRGLWENIAGTAAATAAVAGTEAFYGSKEKSKHEKIEKDNNALLGTVKEVEEMLTDKGIIGVGEYVPELARRIPNEPEARVKFFEALAMRLSGSPIPGNPLGFVYKWNKMPGAYFSEGEIPPNSKFERWYLYEKRSQARGESLPKDDLEMYRAKVNLATGKINEVVVIGVDVEKNKIAYLEQRVLETGATHFIVQVKRIDEFLRNYRAHKNPVAGGVPKSPPPTETAGEEPPVGPNPNEGSTETPDGSPDDTLPTSGVPTPETEGFEKQPINIIDPEPEPESEPPTGPRNPETERKITDLTREIIEQVIKPDDAEVERITIDSALSEDDVFKSYIAALAQLREEKGYGDIIFSQDSYQDGDKWMGFVLDASTPDGNVLVIKEKDGKKQLYIENSANKDNKAGGRGEVERTEYEINDSKSVNGLIRMIRYYRMFADERKNAEDSAEKTAKNELSEDDKTSLVSKAKSFEELFDALRKIKEVANADGSLTSSEELIQQIQELKGAPRTDLSNRPELQLLTETYGLRQKVRELLSEKSLEKAPDKSKAGVVKRIFSFLAKIIPNRLRRSRGESK